MDEKQITYFVEGLLNKRFKLGKNQNYFLGCFAVDEINRVNPFKREQTCFIFNNVQRKNAGEMGHWLLIYTYLDKREKKLWTYFIDSFALNVNIYDDHLKLFLTKLQRNCHTSNFQFQFQEMDYPIQHAKSIVCAAYACYFAVNLYNNFHKKLSVMVKSKFKPRRGIQNDNFVKKFVRSFWPKNSCNMNWNRNNFCPVMTYNDAKCLSACTC